MKSLSPDNVDRVADRVKSLQLDDRERHRHGGTSGIGRAVGWLIVLAVLGVGGYFGYGQYRQWQTVAGVPEIKAVKVAYAPKEEVILSLSGFVAPRSIITMSPRVAGTIIELPIQPGWRVKEGDVLAKIDDAQFRFDFEQAKAGLASAQSKLQELKKGARPEEVRQAEIALEQAKAQLEYAGKELNRMAESLKRGSTVESDYNLAKLNRDQAEFQVRVLTEKLTLVKEGARSESIAAAEAEVDRVKAALDKAQYALEQTVIRAPINGTILEKRVELGELVRPESLQQTGICTLADLSHMEAAVDIQERDFSRLTVGQQCRVVPDAYGDRVYAASLARFQPLVNRARGVIEARVTVTNPDEYLLPDMNCRVEFLHEQPSDAPEYLQVPKQAVREDEGRKSVYVVTDGKAQRRVIETGETIGENVNVTSGLQLGDVVLLAGSQKIAEGQPIRPRVQ